MAPGHGRLAVSAAPASSFSIGLLSAGISTRARPGGGLFEHFTTLNTYFSTGDTSVTVVTSNFRFF
jgi:hypothetical protein